MNTIYLDEDQYFSMTANVTSTGYQSVVLRGYLVERRSDGTYIAPLIPQLFYGWDGTQLQSWRQDIGATGSQVILSRSGGYPKVPKEELFWRKVSDFEKAEVEVAKPAQLQVIAIPTAVWVLLGLVIGGGLLYLITKK